MKRERLQAVLAVSFIAELAVGPCLGNYEVSLGLVDDYRTFRIERLGLEFFEFLAA